jgi:hypothetical protein
VTHKVRAPDVRSKAFVRGVLVPAVVPSGSCD